MTIARTYYGEECGDDMEPYDGWMFVKRRDGTIEHVKTAKTLHDDELEGLAFGQWQDISTAPKVGGFLVFKPENRKYKILVGYVDQAVDYYRIKEPCDKTISGATHWMPLPPPPSEAKDD